MKCPRGTLLSFDVCYKCQHQLLIDIRYSFGVPYSHGYHHLYHLYFFPASCANASTGITRCRMRKCKLDGTDTRVWPGHSRVTPGRFPPSVLELRHAASLADNWFRARRDETRVSVRWKREREREVYPLRSRTSPRNWKVFTDGTIYRVLAAPAVWGEKEQRLPLLRPGHDRGHRRREAIAVWRIHLVVSFDGPNGNCKRVSSADVKKVNCRKIHGSL